MTRRAQLVRTKTLTVADTDTPLDLTWLGKDQAISITIEPVAPDSVEMAGVTGDDFVTIGEGLTINLFINDRLPNRLPILKSTGGNVDVNLIVGVTRHDA